MSSLGPALILGSFLLSSLFGDWHRALTSLAGLPGAILGTIPALQFLYQRKVGVRDILGGFAVFFFVLGPVQVIFLILLFLLLSRPGLTPSNIALMGGSFALALLLSLGLGARLSTMLGLLRPASERLSTLVNRAAAMTGLPPPRVRSLRWSQANAFAFPFSGIVAFTVAAEKELTDDQIIAVAAHELAHLAEPLPLRLVRLSWLLVTFPLCTIPIWIREYALPGFLIPLLWFLVGTFLMKAFARKMEVRADAIAQNAGQDEGELAWALERIYAHNLIPAVMRGSKGQTHPHLYDRMIAAGLEPDFPRPKPPGILLTLLCIALVVMGTYSLNLVNSPGSASPIHFLRPTKSSR